MRLLLADIDWMEVVVLLLNGEHTYVVDMSCILVYIRFLNGKSQRELELGVELERIGRKNIGNCYRYVVREVS